MQTVYHIRRNKNFLDIHYLRMKLRYPSIAGQASAMLKYAQIESRCVGTIHRNTNQRIAFWTKFPYFENGQSFKFGFILTVIN
jgi:hypothetical protein